MIRTQGLARDKEFRSIDGEFYSIHSPNLSCNYCRFLAIVLFGEPIHWETSLQIITDILLTHGNPNITSNCSNSNAHIPIIACNKDLVFKAVADLPRFGHGAFLLCLEALYKVCDFLYFEKNNEEIFLFLEINWK